MRKSSLRIWSLCSTANVRGRPWLLLNFRLFLKLKLRFMCVQEANRAINLRSLCPQWAFRLSAGSCAQSSAKRTWNSGWRVKNTRTRLDPNWREKPRTSTTSSSTPTLLMRWETKAARIYLFDLNLYYDVFIYLNSFTSYVCFCVEGDFGGKCT